MSCETQAVRAQSREATNGGVMVPCLQAKTVLTCRVHIYHPSYILNTYGRKVLV